MKITKRQLKRIIREERCRLLEVRPPPDMDAPGWHPNDTQEWEREARAEERHGLEKEKQAFLIKQQARWEDHWEIESDKDAEMISDILSEAYDKISATWDY